MTGLSLTLLSFTPAPDEASSIFFTSYSRLVHQSPALTEETDYGVDKNKRALWPIEGSRALPQGRSKR